MTRLQFNIMRNLNISIGGLKKIEQIRGRFFPSTWTGLETFFARKKQL